MEWLKNRKWREGIINEKRKPRWSNWANLRLVITNKNHFKKKRNLIILKRNNNKKRGTIAETNTASTWEVEEYPITIVINNKLIINNKIIIP